MKMFVLFLQIGELFQGHFNWRGALQLFLFILMAAIIIAFALFAGYNAFRGKPTNKNKD